MKSKIFTELCDSINNYNNIQNYSEKEGAQMLQMITKCMFSFLKEIVIFGKYKDSFIYLYTLGPCIATIAKSNKTNTSYSFSYDLIRCEFFFYSDIHNGSNLRYIEESFLLDFFRVMNTYKIRYTQTQFCSEAEKNHPDLYRNKKGNLLPLMRNYYVETVYQDNNDSYYKADLSLGMFEVVWCLNQSVDEIFAEACLTMKWLYKFNYNLWKIENIKSKKLINNT